MEIRLYINGHKQFANFDPKKFLEVLSARLPQVDSGGCVNAVIEHAISAATDNKHSDGKPLEYYHMEGLPRELEGPDTGMAIVPNHP